MIRIYSMQQVNSFYWPFRPGVCTASKEKHQRTAVKTPVTHDWRGVGTYQRPGNARELSQASERQQNFKTGLFPGPKLQLYILQKRLLIKMDSNASIFFMNLSFHIFLAPLHMPINNAKWSFGINTMRAYKHGT